MMRVALVHPFHWLEVRRGAERYLHDLAWYLTGAGHEVEVLVSGTPSRVETVGGARVRFLPRLAHPALEARGIGAVETHALPVAALLARRRFDLVHALVPWAVLAARTTGHRVVYTELGHPNADWLRTRPGGVRLYRRVVRSATAATALSGSAAASIEAVTGVLPHVLPPGVRLDRFTPRAGPRSGPPTVLFVSDASEPRKGVDLLLRALPALRRRHPQLKLVLGGPGSHDWALPSLPPDARAALDAVVVAGVGDPDDLPGRYRDATVTALPSRHEAFGLVLVESLAAGTPVVASDADGMREIVAPHVGRSFRPGDVEALAGALLEAIELASAPSTAGACRAHAEQWGWQERTGPAHEALYERVARAATRARAAATDGRERRAGR